MVTCVDLKIKNTYIFYQIYIFLFCDKWRTLCIFQIVIAARVIISSLYCYLCVSDIPQTPLNFTGYSFTNTYVNLTWISGFSGGYDQFFILFLKEGSTWIEVGNLTDPGEGREVKFDHGPLTPGQEYWFRLQSCNKINCSSTPTDVRAVVKGILKHCFILYFIRWYPLKWCLFKC